jgi:hypothetical protein
LRIYSNTQVGWYSHFGTLNSKRVSSVSFLFISVLTHPLKSYIVQHKIVDPLVEEYKLARLCIGYLGFIGFGAECDDSTIKDMLTHGYYAFMDYAAVHWSQHLKAAVGTVILSESFAEICSLLETFLELHWKGPEPTGDISSSQREALKPFENMDNFKKISSAYATAMSQLRFFGEKSKRNSTISILDTVIRIRRLLESIMLETDNKATMQSELEHYYGENFYKCERPSCLYFYRGFSTMKGRERHAKDHELPFKCTVEGCLREDIGFTSLKDLRKHMTQQHDCIYENTKKYLNLEATPVHGRPESFPCHACSKTFTKYYNLKDHMKIHKSDLRKAHQDGKSSHDDTNISGLPASPRQYMSTDTELDEIGGTTESHLIYTGLQQIDTETPPFHSPLMLNSLEFDNTSETPDFLEDFDFHRALHTKTLISISPRYGLFSGGEEIHCHGFNLNLNVEIRFGDIVCEILRMVNSKEVVVIAPQIQVQALPYRVKVKVVDKLTGHSDENQIPWFHYVDGERFPKPNLEPFISGLSLQGMSGTAAQTLMMDELFQIFGTNFPAIVDEIGWIGGTDSVR